MALPDVPGRLLALVPGRTGDPDRCGDPDRMGDRDAGDPDPRDPGVPRRWGDRPRDGVRPAIMVL
jgi:hypothetical protein